MYVLFCRVLKEVEKLRVDSRVAKGKTEVFQMNVDGSVFSEYPGTKVRGGGREGRREKEEERGRERKGGREKEGERRERGGRKRREKGGEEGEGRRKREGGREEGGREEGRRKKGGKEGN